MTAVRFTALIAFFNFVASSAWAQPGPATLIAPSSNVVGSTISFTWNSAPGATWYHYWLGKADTSLVLEQWYTAEHAGCAGGGACAITLTPPIGAGPYIWHVRTWGPSGYGPWSAAYMFTVKDPTQAWAGKLPNSRRFTLVLDGQAVLDNETGLVWQRNARVDESVLFDDIALGCGTASTGGRLGWRVPTFAELRSLFEPVPSAPSRLPLGHPFVVTSPEFFRWTTTRRPTSGNVFVVRLSDGAIGSLDPGQNVLPVWCVRGGTAPNQ